MASKEEDLERMYVKEGLSAGKISKAYRLNYANVKTAESTVLYHLKKNGIARRDRAEHIREVTSEMVDEWVRRYQAGESLKQISNDKMSPVSVWNHLRARGVSRRDKTEAQVMAVTKYTRRQFVGDFAERAYLLGLAWGDLHVSRHGRGVRVKTATTHPEMVKLIESNIGSYGMVHVTPRNSTLTGYEWSVQVDLDRSFEFLLEKYGSFPDWVSEDKNNFQSFLAGFFDAEGSVYLNQVRTEFEISISNQNTSLLKGLHEGMSSMGYDSRLVRLKDSKQWRIYMWKPWHVRTFLQKIPIRHGEKVAKASLALQTQSEQDGSKLNHLIEEWDALRARIKEDRNRLVEYAKSQIVKRG